MSSFDNSVDLAKLRDLFARRLKTYRAGQAPGLQEDIYADIPDLQKQYVDPQGGYDLDGMYQELHETPLPAAPQYTDNLADFGSRLIDQMRDNPDGLPEMRYASGGPVDTPYGDHGYYDAPNSLSQTPPSHAADGLEAQVYARGGRAGYSQVPQFGPMHYGSSGGFAGGGEVESDYTNPNDDYGARRFTREPWERREVRDARIRNWKPSDNVIGDEFNRFAKQHRFNPLSYGMEGLARLDSAAGKHTQNWGADEYGELLRDFVDPNLREKYGPSGAVLDVLSMMAPGAGKLVGMGAKGIAGLAAGIPLAGSFGYDALSGGGDDGSAYARPRETDSGYRFGPGGEVKENDPSRVREWKSDRTAEEERSERYNSNAPLIGPTPRYGLEDAPATNFTYGDVAPQKKAGGGRVAEMGRKIRQLYGHLQGDRFTQAADTTNLDRFSDKGLLDLFHPDRSSLMAALPPQNFQDYALSLPTDALLEVPYNRWKNVPGQRSIPRAEKTLDNYLDRIADHMADDPGPRSGSLGSRPGRPGTAPALWLHKTTEVADGFDDLRDVASAVEGHEGRHRMMSMARLGDRRSLVSLYPANSGELRFPLDERLEYLHDKYFPLGSHTPIFPESGQGRPPIPFGAEPFADGGSVLTRLARHTLGKPKTIKIAGHGEVEALPIKEFEDVAAKFAVRHGNEYPVKEYPPFDEANARRIADAYDAMKHGPNDPRAKRAYDALVDETMDQYRALKDTGADFSFLKEGEADPYARTPSLGYLDLVKNGRLRVFPTSQGYGTLEDIRDNPLLRKVGRVGDLPDATANDAFRVVHDALGHFGPGNPFFRHQGEDRAWRTHARSYSGDALPAATSELRGQNSWVNFGPHGEANRSRSGADTIYADQKMGLLPDFAWHDETRGYAGGGVVSPALQKLFSRSALRDELQSLLHSPKPEGSIRFSPETRSRIDDIYRLMNEQPDIPSNVVPFPGSFQGYDVGGPVERLGTKLVKSWRTRHATALEESRDALNRGRGPNDEFVSPGIDPKLQTVDDPRRAMYPGIYSDPRDIVDASRRAHVPDPGEEGAMYRLFGHTRQSLDELSRDSRPFDMPRPANQMPFIAPAGGRGAEVSEQVLTPRNARRIGDVLDLGRRDDNLRPMRSWYEMSPMWEHMDKLGVGGHDARMLNGRMGVMSPAASPDSEIPRGFMANYLSKQGRLEDFIRYGGLTAEQKQFPGMPQDLLADIGHAYHSTAHVPNLLELETLGKLWPSPKSHKVGTYIAASDPVLPFYERPVGDSHFTRTFGYPDVRTGKSIGSLRGQMKNSEYADAYPWWNAKIAGPLDERPRDAQALAWGLFGPQTGVRKVGPPKLELISNYMDEVAHHRGIHPEQARDQLLSGEIGGYAEGGPVDDDLEAYNSMFYDRGGPVGDDMLSYLVQNYDHGGYFRGRHG